MRDTNRNNKNYYALDAIGEMFSQVKQSVALGLSVVYVERGASLLRVAYSDKIVGDPESGIVHGDVVTNLLDSAGGCAVLSVTPTDHTIAALDLRIDYLQPAEKVRISQASQSVTSERAISPSCAASRITRTLVSLQPTFGKLTIGP